MDWSGQYFGELDASEMKKITVTPDGTIYKISDEFFVYLHSTKNLIGGLIDQIKLWFNLTNNGYIYGNIGSKVYLVRQYEELNSLPDQLTPEQEEQVRKHYTLRLLFGINQSIDRNLRIDNHGKIRSIRELTYSDEITLSQTVLSKWFAKTSPEETFTQMMNVEEYEQINRQMQLFRSHLEELTRSIDSELLNHIGVVLRRAGTMLEIGLERIKK